MSITDNNQHFFQGHRAYPDIIPTEYTLEEWTAVVKEKSNSVFPASQNL